MADPLSLLQKFHTEGKTEEILECDSQIVFGDLAWPKEAKTNFRIYGSETNGKWDYYSLECLLYFLKNIKRSHPDYVKQAKGEVPIVHRPDRRDLIGYLEGNIQKKDIKSIDQSAQWQMPTNFKRKPEEKLDSGSAAKKQRLDKSGSGGLTSSGNRDPLLAGQIKKRLADKLDASQEGGKLSINKDKLKNLSEDLTTDKIAEIRAKLITTRRTRIRDDDEARGSSLSIGDLEGVNREARDIFSRERVWRTRTTILQSSGKTFSKTVTAILASVKAREEGKSGHKPSANPNNNPMMIPGSNLSGGNRPPVGIGGNQNNNPNSMSSSNMPPPASTTRQSLPNYNRYDQEQFRGKDDTHGFNIDKTGTFSGMTLKSVTEGNQANRNKPGGPSMNMGRASNAPNAPGQTPNSAKSPSYGSGGGTSGKRPSRTPIIIIPAAPKSLISMYNAKEILQDLRFMSAEDKKNQGMKRENELLIQRRKEGGLTVPYRVIDNPAKLTNSDWDRVVAVFVMGQAWQFKGWPWEGNPTVIFSKIAAYHLKWDDSLLEKNIGNWAVNVLQLSREKRHLDRAKLMTFWETLDKYMVNSKPHLRF